MCTSDWSCCCPYTDITLFHFNILILFVLSLSTFKWLNTRFTVCVCTHDILSLCFTFSLSTRPYGRVCVSVCIVFACWNTCSSKRLNLFISAQWWFGLNRSRVSAAHTKKHYIDKSTTIHTANNSKPLCTSRVQFYCIFSSSLVRERSLSLSAEYICLIHSIRIIQDCFVSYCRAILGWRALLCDGQIACLEGIFRLKTDSFRFHFQTHFTLFFSHLRCVNDENVALSILK